MHFRHTGIFFFCSSHGESSPSTASSPSEGALVSHFPPRSSPPCQSCRGAP